MANLLLTDGQKGDVLRVSVNKRRDAEKSKVNITDEMRNILFEHYGTKHIALGGILFVRSGKVLIHVMVKGI